MSEPSPRALFFKVFPSIMLPMFLASVDGTIVATALPDIAASLGEVERVSWVVVAYLIAATIAAPVYGRLGDALGRRRMMFGALILFVGASVLCALAPSLTLLIAARGLQGLGGGGLMTLSQALVGEVVPPRERGRYQGYTASVFVASSTFGPVAGGWLTQHLGWHSVFWVAVPLGVLAFAMTFRLPRRAVAGGGFLFDFVGLGLFSLTVGPLLFALEQAQRFQLSAVPLAALLLAVAAVSLRLLIRQQFRVSLPLLPVRLLRLPVIWRSDVMAACMGATLVSLITFLPIYLQVVRGIPPAEVGVKILPLTAFIAFGSMATGQIITRTGRTAILPSFGLPVVAALLLVLAVFSPVLSLTQLPIVLFGIALAIGTAMPVVQVTVQMVAGPRQLGAGSASVQFSRSIGAALGTAIVGAILFGTLAATDPATASLFAEMVQAGPGALAGLAAERVAEVQSQIANAFRAGFAAIACFTLAGAAMAWTLPVRRLDADRPPPAP
jgi:EmrB/QacA subfamily drug resistance transporter